MSGGMNAAALPGGGLRVRESRIALAAGALGARGASSSLDSVFRIWDIELIEPDAAPVLPSLRVVREAEVWFRHSEPQIWADPLLAAVWALKSCAQKAAG